MKKIKIIFTGILISVMLLSSCSNNEEEKSEIQQAMTPVLKTARMLSFESALKDFYESKADNNSNVLHKNSAQTNLEVENQAISLLKELGVKQTDVDAKKEISNDMLVHFALEEYSKKLSLMYNQNNK
jgi:PBP1b-binding outer membrane lipoprotein LpoB